MSQPLTSRNRRPLKECRERSKFGIARWSLCDPDKHAFSTEALCNMADIFACNMGDGKPRYVVGSIRLADKGYVITVSRVFAFGMNEATVRDMRVKEINALQGLTACSSRPEAESRFRFTDGNDAWQKAVSPSVGREDVNQPAVPPVCNDL